MKEGPSESGKKLTLSEHIWEAHQDPKMTDEEFGQELNGFLGRWVRAMERAAQTDADQENTAEQPQSPNK